VPLLDNHRSSMAQPTRCGDYYRDHPGVAATQRHFPVFSNLIALIAPD